MDHRRRARGRRGLLLALLALLALLVVVDLVGSDSVIRGYLRDMGSRPETPLGRFIDEITP